MKFIYKICKVCSFLFLLILISSVSVFVLKKPSTPIAEPTSQIIVGDYVIEKQTVENQVTYYTKINGNLNKKQAVSAAFLLCEIENHSILLLIEDEKHYFQVIISKNLEASVVVSIKQ